MSYFILAKTIAKLDRTNTISFQSGPGETFPNSYAGVGVTKTSRYENGVKFGYVCHLLTANIIILDPEFTQWGPKYLSFSVYQSVSWLDHLWICQRLLLGFSKILHEVGGQKGRNLENIDPQVRGEEEN